MTEYHDLHPLAWLNTYIRKVNNVGLGDLVSIPENEVRSLVSAIDRYAQKLYDATNIDAPEPVAGHAPNGLREQLTLAYLTGMIARGGPPVLPEAMTRAAIGFAKTAERVMLQERAGTVSATVKEDENA